MATYKLHVEDFGKIKTADIEVAPLTLLVGDNNCGKSYMSSLLWALKNYGVRNLFQGELVTTIPDYEVLNDWYKKIIAEIIINGRVSFGVNDIGQLLENTINYCLSMKKDRLIEWLFNTSDVTIGKVSVEFPSTIEGDFEIIRFGDMDLATDESFQLNIKYRGNFVGGIICKSVLDLDKENHFKFIISMIISRIMGISFASKNNNHDIYLPSSRTGFMLTKDIIDQVGRENTFNLEKSNEDIIPFTRPINEFLNVMSRLTSKENTENYLEIVSFIEEQMTDGALDFSELPNNEVRYVPDSQTRGIPLRVVSGVVTELSPIILLLKHAGTIREIYYEEPEICLHPQLQQKMGRVLCRLVDSGVNVVVTTHSDIIIQHINNMISLSSHEDKSQIMKDLGYEMADLISGEKVKVYQFERENEGNRRVLRELECGKYGFEIPTFNSALDRLTNESYTMQE